MATLILGGNTFENCKPVLVASDREVFRLQPKSGDGHLVIDVDLCDAAGNPVATVVKNLIVKALPGVAVKHGPTFSEVVGADGTVIGRVDEVGSGSVRLSGRFGTAGAIAHAKADVLELSGGGSMRGCTLTATGAPVSIDARGAVSLGGAVQPAVRAGFRPQSPAPQLKQQGKRRRS